MDRAGLLRRAIELSALSIALSGLFGIAAVVVAIVTGRLALLGFGFDAVMDSVASAVLIWRFRLEERAAGDARRAERRAEMAVGAVLVALGAILAVSSIAALASGAHAEPSLVGLGISLASVVVLPPLSVAKRRTAERLRSRALRADAVLTGIAAAIAAVSLAGFVLTEALGLHAADPIGALIVSGFLVREGVGAVRGDSEPEGG